MPSKTKPLVSAAAITPSDSTVFDPPYRGLYVGVSGDVAIVLPDDSAVTYVGLAAGIVHPIEFKQVKLTGTTATSIVGGR